MDTVPDPLVLTLMAAAASAVLMTGLWAWHRRLGNAGVVDVGWALSVAVAAVTYAAAGPGHAPRRWLMAAMVTIWGGRLAWHLLRDRVLGRPEDGRYADLRARRRPVAAFEFFFFFQAQAFVAVLLSTPFLIAAFDRRPALSALEIAAVLLWAGALAGETIADRQLARFKARADARGKTCREGLWRYSRHPNYFFEWLVWIAYAIYAAGGPWGPTALAAPALMLYLLFRVTGIPATEAQALRSRGDDYRRYQAATSVFVPWFPERRA